MKRTLLGASLLLSAALLCAQIQVLPDLEVTGESRVRIFLYKKALPYSYESTQADSLQYFLPQSLPSKSSELKPMPGKVKRHYLDVEAASLPSAELHYKYYPHHSLLRNLNFDAMGSKANKDFMYEHFAASGMINTPGDWLLNANAQYQMEESRLSQAKLIRGQAILQKPTVPILGIDFHHMQNELRAYKLDQEQWNLKYESSGLGWLHKSSMDLGDYSWNNSLILMDKRLNVHSSLDLSILGFERLGLHLLYDDGHVYPSLGFSRELPLKYDQILRFSNIPLTRIEDHMDILQEYKHVILAGTQRSTSLPLNLKLTYELLRPEAQGFELRSLSFANRSRYYLDGIDLATNPGGDVPMLVYTNATQNSTTLEASWGKGDILFTQSAELNLLYWPEHNWRVAANNHLLNFETRATYDKGIYSAMLGLKQHYISWDEQQNALEEQLDMYLELKYHIGPDSCIKLRASNLLDMELRRHPQLPSRGIDLALSWYGWFQI